MKRSIIVKSPKRAADGAKRWLANVNNTSELQTQKHPLSRGDVVDALNQNNCTVGKVTLRVN